MLRVDIIFLSCLVLSLAKTICSHLFTKKNRKCKTKIEDLCQMWCNLIDSELVPRSRGPRCMNNYKLGQVDSGMNQDSIQGE